jgi:hypothetical protein
MLTTLCICIGRYRFYFYSYDCGEPRHTHADRENMSAKFWLDPGMLLAENHGFNRKELRQPLISSLRCVDQDKDLFA